MAKRSKITVYRERATGRFVSKTKWERSRARGGTRYVRGSWERKPKAERKISEIVQVKKKVSGKLGVRITIGYDSSKDNSWYLTVIINTRKRLSNVKTAEVVSKLCAEGHFDGMQPLDDESDKTPTDYQFCTFYNFEMVKERGIRIKQGQALLYSWYRNEAFL